MREPNQTGSSVRGSNMRVSNARSSNAMASNERGSNLSRVLKQYGCKLETMAILIQNILQKLKKLSRG